MVLTLKSYTINIIEGASASYTVVMEHAPLEGDETTVQTVTVPDGLLNVSAASLTFTADNWVAIIHRPSGDGVQYPVYMRVIIHERDQ